MDPPTDLKSTDVLTVPETVPELGTILGVWAHPDDEAYLAGGIMHLAAQAGCRVACVTATRGELGTSDPDTWPPDKLARERTRELERCLGILGVEEHVWLDHPDGGCADVPEDVAVDQLMGIFHEVQPRTVLTFGPDGMTGHADHVAVSRWTTKAFERYGVPGTSLHYATVIPEWLELWQELSDRLNVMMDESLIAATPREGLSIDLRVPHEVMDLKLEALRVQATQTTRLIEMVGEDLFRNWIVDERYRLAATR